MPNLYLSENRCATHSIRTVVLGATAAEDDLLLLTTLGLQVSLGTRGRIRERLLAAEFAVVMSCQGEVVSCLVVEKPEPEHLRRLSHIPKRFDYELGLGLVLPHHRGLHTLLELVSAAEIPLENSYAVAKSGSVYANMLSTHGGMKAAEFTENDISYEVFVAATDFFRES